MSQRPHREKHPHPLLRRFTWRLCEPLEPPFKNRHLAAAFYPRSPQKFVLVRVIQFVFAGTPQRRINVALAHFLK